jgi:hypothetical protein
VSVLSDVRAMLARPENDYSWSSWEDAEEALREVDGLIAALAAGDLPKRADIEVLFLATGPIQEVSLSSGWSLHFLALAKRFDAAVAKIYGA